MKRLSYWGSEYLTLTCGYGYNVESPSESGDIAPQMKILSSKGLKESGHIWIDDEKSTNIPLIGSIITEINGHSTKGMTESQFYDIVSSANVHTLKYIDKYSDNASATYTAHIVLCDTPEWLNALDITLFKGYNWKSQSIESERKDIADEHKDISFDVIFDTDIDWSKYHTYDFAIRGNDPLNDKLLLKTVCDNFKDCSGGWLTRDENNPDLLFTITKSSDQSINTTYVPPVIEKTHTGSKTTTRYNWITHTNDYITKDNYTTTKRDGYTKQDKVMNVFLEFSILDAKKISESKSSTPPIIYQATFKRTSINADYNPKEEYQNVCHWFSPPINECITTHLWRSGWFGKFSPIGLYANFPPDQDPFISYVIPGSEADKAGLKKFDKIKKSKYKDGKYIVTVEREKKKYNIVLPKAILFSDKEDGIVIRIPVLEK